MAVPKLPHAPPRLLEHAVALLLGDISAASAATCPWRFGPLVIVSPADDAASAALGRTDAAAAFKALDGGTLDRDIASALAGERLDRLAVTLAARRLVVVDRIDRVSSGERQVALAHLLDACAAVGTVWLVSMPMHPAAGFVPQCASRFSAGLVVPEAALPEAQPHPGVAPPSLGSIIRAAARLHDVRPQEIIGPSRSRTVAGARSLAMYLARRLTGRSFQAIGAACGGRDHSTVMHGVRACRGRLARDPALAADVERIVGDLSSSGPAPRDRARGAGAACRTSVGSEALARSIRDRRRGRRRLA